MTEFDLRNAWNAANAQLRSDGSPEKLIALHNGGHITCSEVFSSVLEHSSSDSALRSVIQQMEVHPEQWVRDVAVRIEGILQRRAACITDIAEITRKSPLQPGVRIRLDGGYEHHSPWWLNGNEYYGATFIQFVSRGPDKGPVAFVELDEEIVLTEACGVQHRGAYALLDLLFFANWGATETVTVHVVDSLPSDVVVFYKTHPFGTEIESHATYRVVATDGT